MPPSESTVAQFLKEVGTGHLERVGRALAGTPGLVHAIGPHPFWGGRPQPLHVAVETTRRAMVELLLDAGADPSGTNEHYDHWSPLMLAINRNQPAIQEELIRRGARIGLLEALMLGDDTGVARLLGEGRLPAAAPNGGSTLGFARTPYAIDRLLALGADLNRPDRSGTTPIESLSRLGASGQPLVRHLIARGARARPEDYARLGDRGTLERLAERDPAVRRSDAVMMGAVDSGHHALVEWLLASGANPNARSTADSRHTALHSAAWNGDLTMVKILVAGGADPTLRDAQYDATAAGWAETAITVTARQECGEVARYLRRLTGEGA
jgi:ankyrin repeat protein